MLDSVAPALAEPVELLRTHRDDLLRVDCLDQLLCAGPIDVARRVVRLGAHVEAGLAGEKGLYP